MKALFALALMLLLGNPQQQVSDIPVSPRIHSVSSGPGVDASVSMCISWACDTSVLQTHVLLTTLADRNWANARELMPAQSERFDAFNGIYSKAADGANIHESAVFTKCGVVVDGLQPDTDYKYVIVEKEDGRVTAIEGALPMIISILLYLCFYDKFLNCF